MNQVATHSRHQRRVTYADYKPQTLLSRPQRIAHFLDWAAINMPKQFHPYNIIVKMIQGYGHTPRNNNAEVVEIRNAMTRAKEVLRDKYHRGCYTDRNLGTRATVDAADHIENGLKRQVTRWIAGKRSIEKTTSVIDTSTLPQNDEGRKMLAYTREVNGAIKLISDERVNKLLPPKKDLADQE